MCINTYFASTSIMNEFINQYPLFRTQEIDLWFLKFYCDYCDRLFYRKMTNAKTVKKAFDWGSKNERGEDTYHVNENDKSVGWYVKESFLPSIVEELEKLSLFTHNNSYTFTIMKIAYCLTIESLLTFRNNIKIRNWGVCWVDYFLCFGDSIFHSSK